MLVVDDDESIVDMVTIALEAVDYQVLSAFGEAVPKMAAECKPDLILLDLMMPELDGAELSRRLRGDPATAAIPIVMMSATTRLYAQDFPLPIDDRLAKPFLMRDLYATVAHWVKSSTRDMA